MYHLLCNGLELSRQPDGKELPIWHIVVLEESIKPEKKLISYANETLLLDVLSVPMLVVPLTSLLQVGALFFFSVLTIKIKNSLMAELVSLIYSKSITSQGQKRVSQSLALGPFALGANRPFYSCGLSTLACE